MKPVERELRGTLEAGQDLVAAGYAGLEGARRIAKAREAELSAWFSRTYIERMQQGTGRIIDEDSVPWREYGATEWECAGEGGIFTALWNLSGAYRRGFQVDLYRIPVRQDTIEVCERYELNPYRLYSKNCVIAAADNGYHLAERLIREGIPAAVIGVVSRGIGREIHYGQVRGFLERPREDELVSVNLWKKETMV
ncbi:MAG: AIR synthase [Hungatella sp.]|nr:AIR synthase [Hungatella sp.]